MKRWQSDNGLQFTILAPWQAETAELDTSQPFRVILPGSREIAVFFYNQDLSTRISFDPASTVNADRFLNDYVIPKFVLDGDKGKQPQLVLISSDGELYGHHQMFRDKFLAHLTNGAIKDQFIDLTYPALWLKKFPPNKLITIKENTSWSCHHGVLRWSGECNCTPNSGWKKPFRQALDLLAKAMDDEYLKILGDRMDDPWELRHRYISVIHGTVRLEDLTNELCRWMPNERDLTKLQTLMRAQYERQRMFTSCGWFFDDYDRIEPKNNTAYAAQATWLTRMATGVDLSEMAGEEFEKVVSWRSGLKADEVFMRHLRRARREWE
jgi:hypothetical protein